MNMDMKMMVMVMVAMMMMGIVMGDIVDQTCKQTPDYTLCVSILRFDPRSSTADTVGLALILVDKIKGLGTETLGQINNAYKTKPMLKNQLDQCKVDYTTIVNSDVKVAISALTSGNPKFGEESVVDAGNEAFSCERRFLQGQNPFPSFTQRMRKLCDVTSAVIKLLL